MPVTRLKGRGWKERIQILVKNFGSREAVAKEVGVSYWAVVSWLTRGIKPIPLVQKRVRQIELEGRKKK